MFGYITEGDSPDRQAGLRVIHLGYTTKLANAISSSLPVS